MANTLSYGFPFKAAASLSAQGIIDRVFENLDDHCRGVSVEDDITLVVIKHKENGKP